MILHIWRAAGLEYLVRLKRCLLTSYRDKVPGKATPDESTIMCEARVGSGGEVHNTERILVNGSE